MLKKRMLLINLRPVEGASYLIQNCRDDENMTFNQCATYLRKNAILIDHVSRAKPSSRLMHVSEDFPMETDEKTFEDAIKIFHVMATEGGLLATYNAFQMLSFRDNLSIPNKIWAKMKPSFKEKVNKI